MHGYEGHNPWHTVYNCTLKKSADKEGLLYGLLYVCVSVYAGMAVVDKKINGWGNIYIISLPKSNFEQGWTKKLQITLER